VQFRDELANKVMKNYLSGTSTSPLSRACIEMEREATCKLIEMLDFYRSIYTYEGL